MFSKQTTRRTTLSLVIAAGTTLVATSALAQDGNKPRDLQKEREVPTRYTTEEQQIRNLTFIRSSDLIGAELRTDTEDDLGNIEDIIVNRGTGKIEYVVISEGSFLGMGGSHIALPFQALVINPAEESIALNVAADTLDVDEGAPLPSGWTRLSDDWEDNLHTMEPARMAREQTWRDRQDRRENGQPADRMERGEEMEINGRITALHREDMGERGDWAVATVETRNEGTKKVVLGPAWHVYGSDKAPIRGDTIQGTCRKGDKDYLLVDRVEINGEQYRFDNDRGEPAWNDRRRTGASSDARRTGALVRLSEINERDAKTRESDWGQIEDSVIEIQSGKVAFLMLDPDENFLGIADEMKVVPWTITSIGNESVVIDATKQMLATAKTLPEGKRVFTMPYNLQEVYKTYEVEQAEFRRDR